mgnify:FL=1|jgi:hypothetical protein
MVTDFLHLLLALVGVLAGAGLLFLMITRRARMPMDDSHD